FHALPEMGRSQSQISPGHPPSSQAQVQSAAHQEQGLPEADDHKESKALPLAGKPCKEDSKEAIAEKNQREYQQAGQYSHGFHIHHLSGSRSLLIIAYLKPGIKQA